VSQNQIRKNGLIFVISGPSGSGKTTLLSRVLKAPGLRGKLVRSISLTTRPKRSGERSGKDYFFISNGRFLQLRKAKKILEWTRYLGYYYATPRVFIERQIKKGNNTALCLDLKGAFRLKRFFPDNTVLIFVKPPSIKVLWKRISKRCQHTKPEEIRGRIQLARREIEGARAYDYQMVNKNFEETVKKLKGIILKELD